MNKKLLLAAAATGLLLASCTQSKSENMSGSSVEKGECHRKNACKANGNCGGKENTCSGKNACKGSGMKKMANCAKATTATETEISK